MTVESLYPFLYGGDGDTDAVVREATASTAAKVAEIVSLRRGLVDRIGKELEQCAASMAGAFASGARLFAFGNGGSSTDAHDIAHLFMHPPRGRGLPGVSLAADTAVVTALANDVGFDVVFARQLAALARPGDIALGVSTSGGSENVLQAFAAAKRIGLLTVGLAGYEGGAMADARTVDYLFVVPSSSVHRIQEAQTTVYHVLWALTQEALASA